MEWATIEIKLKEQYCERCGTFVPEEERSVQSGKMVCQKCIDLPWSKGEEIMEEECKVGIQGMIETIGSDILELDRRLDPVLSRPEHPSVSNDTDNPSASPILIRLTQLHEELVSLYERLEL